MDTTAPGRTWDEASSPASSRLASRFEADWRRTRVGAPPDPLRYLPDDPDERPGALLALLRTDLALRLEDGEPVPLEWYLDRHPDLGSEGLVALIYEEFCLLEEAGQPPDPAEYAARFPEVADRLGRVLEIHDLVGSVQATALHAPAAPSPVPFPEAGQTIGGFRLVEELGRGSFARVFLAEERLLADRPVALKVARKGSREPQTLARLQHTHIVPVHSYRTDPATDLHLLCMPFFGRLTLASVLADPATSRARTGADLVAILERLQPARDAPGGSEAKRTLAALSFERALAWWGARMAEALHHAHERGVLHRDVKPSNVLVTADGMPMLLDFNLAQGPLAERPDDAPAAVGGTLAYMAPEHLEALAEGMADDVDALADVYALGVVLFEALAGSRPFGNPAGALSVAEALDRAAEERRSGPPPLRPARPEVSRALEAVVRKCLAPEPSARYRTAADLAADLQAVAADGPLLHAVEPEPARTLRRVRRNRRRLAMVGPVVAGAAAVGLALGLAQVERVRRVAEVGQGVWELIAEGQVAKERGEFDLALRQFDRAATQARGWPGLENEYRKAREQSHLTEETRKVRADADRLLGAAGPIRYRLLGFGGDPAWAMPEIRSVLAPFYVLTCPPGVDWTELSQLAQLDPGRRDRVVEEVNEILFLWAVALDDPGPVRDPEDVRRALDLCDRGLAFVNPKGPWRALRDRFADAPGADRSGPDAPGAETSARACFEWALLRRLEGRPDRAIAWLDRAIRLEPGDFWYQFALAMGHREMEARSPGAGHADLAFQAQAAAIALDARSQWAWRQRARLHLDRGDPVRALADLARALELVGDSPFPEARIDQGRAYLAAGDPAEARAAFDRAIAEAPGTPPAREAEAERARLDREERQPSGSTKRQSSADRHRPSDAESQHEPPQRAGSSAARG